MKQIKQYTREHTKLTRRYFLQTGVASVAALYSSLLLAEAYPTEERHMLTEAITKEPKPNLIFILVDDQGYYDLGCYGGKEFDTPRIDRMAKEGILFTDYYAAAPICSPSRAAILTGCYPRRIGLATWVQRADSRKGIHPDELTLAELLKSSGYATACIGKWHLGFLPPFLSRQQGFDHYFGLLHNLDPVEVVYFEDEGGVPLMRNEKILKRPANPAELTEAYTNEAISFIRKNKDRPFFLYLPHTMAHNPLGVTDDFKGKSRFGLYGDVIQCLDHHVGRLFDTLKELGIETGHWLSIPLTMVAARDEHPTSRYVATSLQHWKVVSESLVSHGDRALELRQAKSPRS